MSTMPGQRSVAIVSACMRGSGTPELVLTEVNVTEDEFENGVHYTLAEKQLVEKGYEADPVVHFADSEGPPFLHPAVRAHLEHAAMPVLVVEGN